MKRLKERGVKKWNGLIWRKVKVQWRNSVDP